MPKFTFYTPREKIKNNQSSDEKGQSFFVVKNEMA